MSLRRPRRIVSLAVATYLTLSVCGVPLFDFTQCAMTPPAGLTPSARIAAAAGANRLGQDETVCDGCKQVTATLPDAPPPCPAEIRSEWDLWKTGTCLRGANIWQAVVYKDRDRKVYGEMETRYGEDSFEKLKRWRGNYVNISHPGTFSEKKIKAAGARGEEYRRVDPILANLRQLIEWCAKKELFVVISFRTGPGRSELVFEEKKKSGLLAKLFETDDRGRLKDEAAEAQDAWVRMWQDTACEFKDAGNVVGYDLMVEPVTKHEAKGGADMQRLWAGLAGRIADGIRNVAGDKKTPIIVGGINYSSACSLACMRPADFAGRGPVVFGVHQYAPYDEYTHQENKYAAFYCDGEERVKDKLGEKHSPRAFDSWVKDRLTERYGWVNGFKSRPDAVPVAVNEYGASRWAGEMRGEQHFPDAGRFLTYQMELIEKVGANHALWLWEAPHCVGPDKLNFQNGTDPGNHWIIARAQEDQDGLIFEIKKNWNRNVVFATPELLRRLSAEGGAAGQGVSPRTTAP